ncbi:hypothetical protein [Mucilaginibacter sp.]|uniref:hypothetical protein n=1 Tax=Mucilaginibacter sp. TaxID=1882438 RepID=UPI003B0059C7
MEMKKVKLTIEKGEKVLWGSIKYNNNLIADYANNLTELESKLKKHLQEFEDVEPETVTFKHN